MVKERALSPTIEQASALPSSVDFMLLGGCNLNCPFCFGPQHELPAMKTDSVIETVQKLATNGVERIVFTGGEPTLINDLPNILTVAKNSGLTTVLSTNGILLSSNDNLLRKVAPLLDWLALPLEGDSPEANANLRIGFKTNAGVEHFKAIVKLIPKVRKEYPNLKVKLGTVVAQPNIDSIEGIPEVLASHQAIPDTWKLYQISPSEYGKINFGRLRVTDEEYEEISMRAEKKASQVGIANFVRYTNKERPGKYMFINPEGEVLIISQEENDYTSIGNVLDDFAGVTKNWGAYVNKDSLRKNFEMTYPY